MVDSIEGDVLLLADAEDSHETLRALLHAGLLRARERLLVYFKGNLKFSIVNSYHQFPLLEG
jgi:hypothetical protein